MAREEESREDLLREATALVARVEFDVEGFEGLVLSGFRRDGAASFFFGQQVVYQFNAARELRRAFLHGQLYKAEEGHLVELTRHRTKDAVDLLRHELTDAETAKFVTEVHLRMHKLHEAVCTRQFRIVGEVPPDEDVASRVCVWLEQLAGTLVLARSPRVDS